MEANWISLFILEIRAHGVGYYGFAKDDLTRANQLHELKKLSAQTESTRDKVQKERSQKKLELRERLRKVRQRKRAKMGLPPLEEKEDGSEEEEESSTQDETIKSNEEEIKPLDEPPVMRPWDFGKPGVFGPKPVNFDELDAKWLQDRRLTRNAEFAPPSLYAEPVSQPEAEVPSSSSSSSSYKYYQSFVKSSTPLPPAATKRVYEPAPHYSVSKQQTPTPIQDELPAPAGEGSEDWKRGARTEVAPPPTYDYYHGESGQRAPKVKGK
jgi:hypothetical protein